MDSRVGVLGGLVERMQELVSRVRQGRTEAVAGSDAQRSGIQYQVCTRAGVFKIDAVKGSRPVVKPVEPQKAGVVGGGEDDFNIGY